MKQIFLTVFILIIASCCSHLPNETSEYSIIEKYEIINFGEFHGTNEMPKTFFSMVKKYAQINSNETIALGLEIPREEESLVVRFVRTGNDLHLQQSTFFNQPYQDGRGSSAIVESLRSLVGIKNIKIFCFDQNQPYTESRDEVMAKNILKFSNNKKFSKVFTYSGNLHPQKTIGTPWDKSFKSMGVVLEELSAKRTLAIRGEFSQGDAWICQGMTPDTCGVRSLGSIIISRKESKEGLITLKTPIQGYDALYRINKVTPSYPWSHKENKKRSN
ncbi:MAG: hypothetical protein VXV96_01625 [Bdellovibrionota bacterium]|nr:hypothetical protein [Bdellovibrionota bacterium]